MSKKLLSAGIVMVLVAAVLVGVGAQSASAMTCSEVETLISIMGSTPAQAAQIRTLGGCGVTTTTAAAYTFTKDLTVGSTGADVTALQTMLGVTPATGYFGAITKAAVVAYQTSKGITPAAGYVGPATRASLNANTAVVTVPTTPTTPTTPVATGLEGGAGDSAYDSYNTGVKSSVKDGEEDVKVAGLKIEAVDSDISVNNIKIELTASGTESTRVSKYIDSVDIYMGSEKVGSEDVSDFSKNGTTYSKSIGLSDAVVKADEKTAFFVVFNAVDDIDEDNDGAEINLAVVSYRFADGDGVVSTVTIDDIEEVVELDLLASNDVSLKSASSNPADSTIAVDEDNSTDDVLALAFKIDNDEDSTSDVTLTSLPVLVTFGGTNTIGDASNVDWAEQVIDSITVEIDGTDYEAELTTDSTNGNASGTAVYTVDLDGEDVVIAAGDIVDAKVYITFAEQDGNYTSLITVKATVVAGNIEAEDEDGDVVTLATGSKAGATLTLSVSPALITGLVASASKDSDSTVGTFTFTFKVEADGDDIDLDSTSFDIDVIGGTTTPTFSIIKKSGTVATGYTAGSSYTVEDGNNATFTVTYTVEPTTSGTYYIQLNSISDVSVDETAGPVSLIGA